MMIAGLHSARWLLAVALLAVFASARSSADVPDSGASNVGYRHFELMPIKVTGRRVHPKVMAKFRAGLDKEVTPLLAQWNANARGTPGTGTLDIQITITDMKFVSGSKRFWVGPFYGSSHAAGDVAFVDHESGENRGQESFNVSTGAWAGTVTVGGLDNAMIDRLANQMAQYIGRCTEVCFGSGNDSSNGLAIGGVAGPAAANILPAGGSDLFKELTNLDELRKKGILTESEFQEQKKLVLERYRK